MYERLKNGKIRRRCRTCRNLRNNKSHVSNDQIIIGGEHLADNTLYDRSKLTIDDRLVMVKFDKALDLIDTKCKGNAADFVDWDATETDVSQVPSPGYAEDMCKDCPLFDLCDRSAEAAPPAWGVRAGKVYIYGNIFTKGEKNGSSSNRN